MTISFAQDMTLAYALATNSPDPSTQNGAVLCDDSGRTLGLGWNDFPDGVDEKFWHGEKADKYARVVHAEVAAILCAARDGFATDGSTLVCPWAACSNCAKHIAAAGVKRLVRHPFTADNHWGADCVIGDEIMTGAGVEIVEIESVPSPYDGIQLRRNGGIWTP